MKNSGVVLIGIAVGCLCSGCQSIGPEANAFGDGRVTTASANQMFDPGFEEFNDEKLLLLLDPKAKTTYQQADSAERISALSSAFLAANQGQDAVARRNQILNHLIAASNQRCNLYETYIKRISTYTNGIFGTLTTVLGGAGAIVTGENTARLLSGLAGISSGTRAELNQAVFESVATSIIIPGIRKSREEFLKKEIYNKVDEKKGIDIFPIEWAVAVAIAYHGLCSMDTGVAYAQKTIQSYDDLGIKKYIEIQGQINESLKKAKIDPLKNQK